MGDVLLRCSGRAVWARLGLVFTICWSSALCQTQEPAATLADRLQSLATRAATAFVGQVIAISRNGGIVAIDFRVDEPVLGNSPRVYRLREWAGLWPSEQVRYTVGERALVFLHGANRQEFSSPVDGGEGVLPVVVQGADTSPLLDVRRLEASILRPVGTRLSDPTDGAVSLSEALNVVRAAAASLASDVRFGLTQRPLPEQGTRLHSASSMNSVSGTGPGLTRTVPGPRDGRRVLAEVPREDR